MLDCFCSNSTLCQFKHCAVDLSGGEVQEEIGLDVLVHGEPERSDMCVPHSCS